MQLPDSCVWILLWGYLPIYCLFTMFFSRDLPPIDNLNLHDLPEVHLHVSITKITSKWSSFVGYSSATWRNATRGFPSEIQTFRDRRTSSSPDYVWYAREHGLQKIHSSALPLGRRWKSWKNLWKGWYSRSLWSVSYKVKHLKTLLFRTGLYEDPYSDRHYTSKTKIIK